MSAPGGGVPGRLLRAWLLTALIDGLFASFLSMVVYNSTFSRLWQGVASVPLGREALEMGNRAVAIGLLLHLAVAFTWSAVFLLLVMRAGWVRRVLESPWGVLKAALVYGPLIWLVMSLAVIPAFTGRPPSITSRWWVNLVGHIPFVAWPMIAMLARRPARL
jgi:hypothetical protein